MKAPLPPDDDERADLNRQPIDQVEVDQVAKPAWLSAITQLRDHIKPCALRFQKPDGVQHTVWPIYLKRSPMELHSLTLTPSDPTELETYGEETSDDFWLHDWAQVFHIDTSKDIKWTDFGDVETAGVQILMQVYYRSPAKLVSDNPWLPLQMVIDNAEAKAWPKRVKGEGQGSGMEEDGQAKAFKKALIKKHPDLAPHMTADTSKQGAASSSGGKAEVDDEQATEDDFDEDELFQGAIDHYEKHRPETDGLAPFREEHFQAVARAGGDVWQGQVKRKYPEAQQWCKDHDLQETQKVPLSLGEEVAKTVSSAWAHRMQFLYDAFRAGTLATPGQAAKTMEAYQDLEPEDFKQVMETATGKALDLGLKIRRLRCIGE